MCLELGVLGTLIWILWLWRLVIEVERLVGSFIVGVIVGSYVQYLMTWRRLRSALKRIEALEKLVCD